MIVEGTVRADAEEQESADVARPHPGDRQHQGGLGNVAPPAHRQRIDARAQLVHPRDATRARHLRERPGGGAGLRFRKLQGRGEHVGRDARRPGEPRASPVRLEQIEQREGNVTRVGGERADGALARLLDRPRLRPV